MLRVEQMPVAVQYAPRIYCALLVQRCDHATDDIAELVSQSPGRRSHDDLLSTCARDWRDSLPLAMSCFTQRSNATNKKSCAVS
jgi:hypothetical protein